MIESLITFIIVFGIIVVVHEYGHLWWAKRAGILVREFAIGMGPKIFAHQAKDGTMYTLRILPVGGYVRMAGWGDDQTEIKKGAPASLVINTEEDASQQKVSRINLSDRVELENSVPILVTDYDFEHELFIEGEVFGEIKRFSVQRDATIIEEDGTELRIAPIEVQYQSVSVPKKILTNFGGPLNNFILGFIAFVIVVFMQGGVPSNTTQLGTVPENQPAYQAGLRKNDKVLSVNGQKVATWEELVKDIQTSDGKALKFEIERQNQQKTITVTPKKSGNTYVVGIGSSMKTGIIDTITGGFTRSIQSMGATLTALKQLFTSPSLDKLGGPVAIYQLSGQAAQGGVINVISFLAMLSINLGIVNLIPIPVLDGGKIILNFIEGIRRKPLSQEKESIITLVGVVFMLILFVAVTWNDIMRAFIR